MLDNLLSVMMVDDDSVDAQSFEREFRKINMSNPLFFACDGVEALDKLRGTNGVEKIIPTPKIILLDINMPKMNGLEFLKELRNDKDLHSTFVFVLTSSKEDKDRVDAYNYNVAGYILKPVTFQNFIGAIGTLKDYWKLNFNSELE